MKKNLLDSELPGRTFVRVNVTVRRPNRRGIEKVFKKEFAEGRAEIHITASCTFEIRGVGSQRWRAVGMENTSLVVEMKPKYNQEEMNRAPQRTVLN